jgi:hypothetical protein
VFLETVFLIMTRTIGIASSMGRIVNQENSGTVEVGEGVTVGLGETLLAGIVTV